jgi:hypothetical protein
MAKKKLSAAVETLFKEVGKEHHEAFKETEGKDAEWPIWYAERLQERLAQQLDSDLTKSRIVFLLMQAEKRRAKKNPKGDWPRFYAKYFVKRLK